MCKRYAPLLLALALPVQLSALDIDDYSSATNDRFANDNSFVADAFDLSGVGRSSDGRWATLLSENVFISANHFHPSTSSTVTFFETNDPNGPSLTLGVEKGQQIGSSDIWLGVLESPVSSGYTFYDYATEDISDSIQFALSPYAGENSYMVGQSPSSFGNSTNVAVGRNILDDWFSNTTVESTTDDAVAATNDSSGDPNYVQYETLAVNFDSGAPLMVDLDGDGTGPLTLVGANWFVATDGSLTGMSYTGNHDEEIQSYIEANAIPEPGTGILLLIGGLPLLLRRRCTR